ncbi:CRISPR-associated endonuclease Cas2 [Azoarcus sp. PA01]|nr:CRISPR-associated endonuclease Cas2 [Azoarcus sp. PA01]KON82490.1 CRISPR-associated endonuclease Cas2 [Azoarcus sp. PA01]
MALSNRHDWLIAYDIADSKRLQRLHRFLVHEAVPVQYSVFYFEGSVVAMSQLMGAVEKRIDSGQDDVRAYQLPAHPQIDTIGRGSTLEEITLLSATTPQLKALLAPQAK